MVILTLLRCLLTARKDHNNLHDINHNDHNAVDALKPNRQSQCSALLSGAKHCTVTLRLHLRCVYIYIAFAFTLCLHLHCIYIYIVFAFTLRLHLHCVYI